MPSVKTPESRMVTMRLSIQEYRVLQNATRLYASQNNIKVAAAQSAFIRAAIVAEASRMLNR